MLYSEFKSALIHTYEAGEIQAIWNLIQDENIAPESLINRLLKEEPIQYILGTAWFYNRKFGVNESTLIPRPETEELCQMLIKNVGNKSVNIADIGTGSGCIAVTLALELTQSKIKAYDISGLALKVARENATIHSVDHHIQFECIDFLAAPNVADNLDYIISNPPYIDRKEMANMGKGVLEFEPYMALFPTGHDPLIFYKKLNELLGVQKQNCTLFAEINAQLPQETLNCFSENFEKILHKEITGKTRFIEIKKGS